MSEALERAVEELRADLARMEARVRALERKEVRFGGALVGRTSLSAKPELDTEDAMPVVKPLTLAGPPPPPSPIQVLLNESPAAPPPLRPDAPFSAPPPPPGLPRPQVAPSSGYDPYAPPPPPPFKGAAPSPPMAARQSEDLESTMGLTWVNRIGAVTLILAAGFVFKYAADNGWIGPWLRVLVGMLAGGAACAGAEWLVRRGHRVVGQGVAGFGVGILYFSLFAAFQIFELLPQLAVFGLMMGVTLLGGALAIRYQSQALAILAIAGGFLTPVMLSTGENKPWELNLYLLVLAGGAIYLAIRQRWQGLAWAAYLGTKALYWVSVFADEGSAPYYPSLVFGVLYYALFLLTPWRGIAAVAQVSFGFAMLTGGAFADQALWSWQLLLPLAVGVAIAVARKRPVEAVAAMITAHLSIAFGIVLMLDVGTGVAIPKDAVGMGVLFGVWALFAAWALAGWLRLERVLPENVSAMFALNSLAFAGEGLGLMEAAGWETKGAFLLALAALHLVLGIPSVGALFHPERFAGLGRVSQVLAVFFLACAIPLQLDGPVIAAVWAGMGLALAWTSSTRRAVWMEACAYVLFAASFVRIVGVDLLELGAEPVPFGHGVFFTAILLGACMLGAAWLWRGASHWWAAAIGGHGMVLISLITEAVRLGERSGNASDALIVQTALVSVILSVYAALLVATGVVSRSRAHRIGGLVLLMIVVVKLYLFDVWLLNTVFRILAFGVLGTMLLATSFLYSRLKGTVKSLLAEESVPPPPGLA